MRHISLKSTDDQKIWIVSDLHLGHDKPFILDPRQYKSVNEAYEHTYQMLHEFVRPQDILINLGDAVIGAKENSVAYAKRLVSFRCKAQYYIWGNHNAGMQSLYDDCRSTLGLLADDVEVYPLNYPGTNFHFMGHRMEMTIDGVPVVFDHYPIASWNEMSKGAYMIHGHCHRNLKEDATLKRVDVSWEWQRRPVEWNEVNRYLKDRTCVPVDHHGKKAAESFFE